jgi:hypothetical protein
MLTTGSITTETFSAALLGLEDLSLRVTAAALHVASNPEKHPRLRLMLEELSEVMQCCGEDLGCINNRKPLGLTRTKWPCCACLEEHKSQGYQQGQTD